MKLPLSLRDDTPVSILMCDNMQRILELWVLHPKLQCSKVIWSFGSSYD